MANDLMPIILFVISQYPEEVKREKQTFVPFSFHVQYPMGS